MPDVAPLDLVSLLVNTGFAGLFVWLLIDTRREAQRREDRLSSLLDKYIEQLRPIAETLKGIEKALDNQQRNND